MRFNAFFGDITYNITNGVIPQRNCVREKSVLVSLSSGYFCIEYIGVGMRVILNTE